MLRAAAVLLLVVPGLASWSLQAPAQDQPPQAPDARPEPPGPQEPPPRPSPEDVRRHEKELMARIAELERALAEAPEGEPREGIKEELNRLRVELKQLRVPGRERGREKGPMPQLSPEELKELMEFAKEFEPDMFRRLQDMREEERPRVAHELRRRMMEMRMLKEKHPEEFQRRKDMAQLEKDSHELAEKIRNTTDEAERAKLKDQLTELLSKLFDLREQGRAKEIENLERRVAELKKTLDKRKENKAKIVEKRTQEMLGGEYEW